MMTPRTLRVSQASSIFWSMERAASTGVCLKLHFLGLRFNLCSSTTLSRPFRGSWRVQGYHIIHIFLVVLSVLEGTVNARKTTGSGTVRNFTCGIFQIKEMSLAEHFLTTVGHEAESDGIRPSLTSRCSRHCAATA